MVSLNTAPPVNGQELLAEFMQYGREGPFEEIVRRYAGMVFNVCLRVTKDKHDAEDTTQAVFLTLAIQVRRGAQIKALGPWLQQVAKRLALDLRRSKSRRVIREERHHVEQTNRLNDNGDSLPQADLEEVKVILHEELDKLPAKYRLPLILHYFGGLSREEMAAELRCKPSTLGVRIFRGREMLAGRLSGRGINMSSGTFAVAMAYTIRSAVSHAMISSTSHAASALAVGHDGIGLVSARVIGLTRRAAGVVAFGKIKLATVATLIAFSSLGAGAKAFGMLPRIDLGRIITEQVRRLIRPVTQSPVFQLRADARPVQMVSPVTHAAAGMPVTNSPNVAVAMTSGLPAASSAHAPSVDVAPTPLFPSGRSAPYLNNFGPSAQSHAVAVAPDSTVDTTSTSAHATSNPQSTDSAPVVASSATSASSSAAAGPVGLPQTSSSIVAKFIPAYASSSMRVVSAAAAKNLFVTPLSKHLKITGSGGTTAVSAVTTIDPTTMTYVASPAAQVVRIPAEGGSVISSDGLLSGYGKVNLTGTLDVCGQVVATGQGVDRTLNLTSFQSIKDDGDSDSGAPHPGWFAENHGRLMLRLLASSDGTSLNWGEDPADSSLRMVNAVRLANIDAPAGKDPTQLALLATDRTDLPDLSTINGTPIGLWQVDPALEQINSADLSIRYDEAAVLTLGDRESDLRLWTLSYGSWEPVPTDMMTLDTMDHIISGTGRNFDYFAVAAPAGNGADISNLIAVPAGAIATNTSPVPEPVGLSVLGVSAAGLLARRRRR